MKRYQYERYALLCRLAYPSAIDSTPSKLKNYVSVDVFDQWGRPTSRVLWKASKNEVIVVSRGSTNFTDWLVNLALFPTKYTVQPGLSYFVHWGYLQLLEQPNCDPSREQQTLSVYQKIEDILLPLINSGKRVTFTGHSSGGAMAVLMADRFERKCPNKVKRVVTFGQPAIGLSSFKRHYLLHRKTYRICCDLDIVTFLPPLPLVYWHVGRMLWLHDETIYENTPSGYRLYKSIISWLLRPFTYHYMRKYIRNKDYFDEI
ncbi:lipase family protein [Agarivorans sp. MS3-6]|uniref:lipase family protein n=1 Tax=Agarivorans sp. TSD2052 TaxID=2937286 RepID=UPI00200CFF12|nr:lipase [Agarivorans sp. TSD2052]UPW20623.1 lipase [Agarivorans sp. TSD2052]